VYHSTLGLLESNKEEEEDLVGGRGGAEDVANVVAHTRQPGRV